MIFEHDIEACLEVLHNGGLILYPTDTVWGIGCDATNEKAVSKIYTLKNRNEQKSMIILLADEADVPAYTDQENVTIFDYIKGIQKPTTVIYDKAKNLARNLLAEDGSVGMRIVKDKFCKRLITEFGRPIVSTSSNVSGYPPPMVFSDIDVRISEGVDYVVKYRQDDTEPALPSTVIRLNENGSITILRP
ncbi:L-threonylcarbamoyladenylate synthase [Ferruginibacter sp. HRS2-29]|uniref:L-threonylcarbamoyladenylate synthase n=1 Tax=Ferruginibacter sp. HRS2-29 TaxID=2487334 RepID=UPI0020CE2AF7|nr:threonylcarbamoyl-AMP synthase [Ferruginibacter sp. HRS2-29]